MARFRIAKRAATDLDEIWLTIALDNIDAADRVIDQIYRVAELLSTQPEMNRAREALSAGLRSFVTKTPYIVYYMIEPNGVVVGRVLHHARDVDAVFFDAQ